MIPVRVFLVAQAQLAVNVIKLCKITKCFVTELHISIATATVYTVWTSSLLIAQCPSFHPAAAKAIYSIIHPEKEIALQTEPISVISVIRPETLKGAWIVQ